jgi:hypothetical protein
VLVLDDASIEETLRQLGFAVDDPPSAEPHRTATREASEPADVCSAPEPARSRGLPGGRAARTGSPAPGVASPSDGRSPGSRRSPSWLGRRRRAARARGLPRACTLPNVRRGLDVRRPGSSRLLGVENARFRGWPGRRAARSASAREPGLARQRGSQEMVTCMIVQ